LPLAKGKLSFLFPFLIGRLKTGIDTRRFENDDLFPFLIGRLKTEEEEALK